MRQWIIAIGWTALLQLPAAATELKPDVINAATFTGKLPSEDRINPLAVKVQVLLDRARFSPGEIDGITPGTVRAPPNHHRRRATATPNRNATSSEPRGASRAMLLKMLNGIPGFRPVSIASPIGWAVSFTASDTFSLAG